MPVFVAHIPTSSSVQRFYRVKSARRGRLVCLLLLREKSVHHSSVSRSSLHYLPFSKDNTQRSRSPTAFPSSICLITPTLPTLSSLSVERRLFTLIARPDHPWELLAFLLNAAVPSRFKTRFARFDLTVRCSWSITRAASRSTSLVIPTQLPSFCCHPS